MANAGNIKAKKAHHHVIAAAGQPGSVYGPNDMPIVTYPTDRVLPVLSFSVYGLPSPQGSKKIRYIKGKPVPVEVSDGLEPWRAAVRSMASQAIREYQKRTGKPWAAIAEPVFITLTLTLPASAAATKRKDIYACRAPDADKLMRAVGDAISPIPVPPSVGKGCSDALRKKLRAEALAARRKVSIMHDDSYIMWGPTVKVYPKCTPTALEHPGAVIQIWRMSDLDNYRIRPIFKTSDGMTWARADDLRRWVTPASGSWDGVAKKSLTGVLSLADKSPAVIKIHGRVVTDDDAATLALILIRKGPDEWIRVNLAEG